ncbi:MAG: serine/threonine-protein phosphatase [Acidobacteria bacterium]|nr:serine/threonine-protein phosphatase [Acidobacteriota bacterium]
MSRCASCDKPISVAEAFRQVELGDEIFLICCPMCLSALEAGDLQRQMMPRSGSVAGVDLAVEYRPAMRVGGDYALVKQRGDDELYLVVADVSGHGLKPSLLVSRLSALVENLAEAGTHVTAIAESLNDEVFSNFRSEHLYLTLFAASLSAASRTITYCNCGHPAPLLWSRSEAEVRRLDAHHLPVGLFESKTFGKPVGRKVTFRPGDRLAVFTDGLTELELEDGSELGESGLIDLLEQRRDSSPSTAGRHVFERLHELSRGGAQDDLLLICCDFS